MIEIIVKQLILLLVLTSIRNFVTSYSTSVLVQYVVSPSW